MIAGVDEAGRGSALGPLVIAGVASSRGDMRVFKAMGAKDSKLLGRERREELYREITSRFNTSLVKLEPSQIDRALQNKISLNHLEAEGFAGVLNELAPHEAVVDCVGRNPRAFSSRVHRSLKLDCSLTVRKRAEIRYPIVAAASVVAKVERDRSIAELSRSFGNIGSGYPSDPATLAFLERWLRQNHKLPHFVRTSWATVKKLQRENPGLQTLERY